MLCVYPCIAAQHQLEFVVAAGLVCALAAFTAFGFHARAAGAERARVRLRWLTGAALVTGGGVWATHFAAMLAFKPDVTTSYDVGLTVLSMVIVVSATWLGLALALWRPSFAINGGAVVGGGAGIMHYIGMSALRVPAELVWDEVYVGASIAIGMVLGATALWIATRSPALRHRSFGAALLALGIVSLHFTAVAAASLPPVPMNRGNSDYATIKIESARGRGAKTAAALATERGRAPYVSSNNAHWQALEVPNSLRFQG